MFDGRGEIKELASSQAEIEAILGLMRELGCEQLNQEVKSSAPALEGYCGYYQRVEQVYQGLTERYPREVAQTLACGWRMEKQGANSKDYSVRKRLAQEAEFYYDYAASLPPTGASEIRKEVV